MAATALTAGWLLFEIQKFIPAVIVLLIFIGQIFELIHYLNKVNRQIAWFFEAVRNDDTTLKFPINTGNKSLNDLNLSLNKLNELIKNIKIELQKQEQYYKTILENINIGILSINEKGAIYLANTASCKMLNRDHLTHINQLSQVDKKLYSAIKELQPGDRKLVTFSGNNGLVQLSVKSTLFKTARETFQLITMQDIKSELEIKELESWIKLIRVLTHEIMNTIAPITSLSETILNYYKNLNGEKPDERVIKNTMKGLEVIKEQGNGLMEFVETYRKFTRLPKPEKQSVLVTGLFEKITTLVKSEPENQAVQLLWKLNPSDLEIYADKKQVSQVLVNLVKNSLDAIRNNELKEIFLQGNINSFDRPQITVTDNGPGIPVDVIEKIFIPFFTTKESGSGIGLSLSRQIMLMHGGSLKVESIPGKQTVAIMEF